jgi:hypothetical protein
MADKPSQADHNPRPEGRDWLDKPSSVWLLVGVLILACVLVLGLEFVIHRHVEFEFESWRGFYAAYGFIAYCFIVLSAKQFRKLVRRDEDYYDG